MYEEDINFDDEFDEDEDEAFYEMLREAEAEALEKGIVSITDTEKVKMANGVFEVLKKMLEQRKDVKVYMRQDSPAFANMQRGAYICAEGKNLSFVKTEWFAGIVNLGDNFEVYAKLDGSIHLSIGIGIDEVHVLDGGDE